MTSKIATIESTCLYCNSSFLAKTDKKRFCSIPCSTKARQSNVCIIEWCSLKQRAKGYCASHYQNYNKTGDPLNNGVFVRNGLCLYCSKTLPPGKTHKKFCNRQCQSDNDRNRPLPDDRIWNCEVCFIEMTGDKYPLNTTSCSKECSGKRNRIVNSYNITMSEYHELMSESNGICVICNNSYPLVIDHCHTTQKVRGAICNFCNTGLGMFKDNIESLQNAIDYLS